MPRVIQSVCLTVALIAAGRVSCLGAQSTSDLAAFSALIISPVGALPPAATDNGTSMPDRASLGAYYGRWRYDIDDAIHHNLGATFTGRVGATGTSVSVTGAYLSSSCDCSGWGAGGVSLSSILWTSALPGPRPMSRSIRVALDLAVGGARYAGAGHASGSSVAGQLDVGGSASFVAGSRVALSFLSGFGVGHLSSADATATGGRPLIGAAGSWTFRSAMAVDVGVERVILKGGPMQLGAGLSWHHR